MEGIPRIRAAQSRVSARLAHMERVQALARNCVMREGGGAFDHESTLSKQSQRDRANRDASPYTTSLHPMRDLLVKARSSSASWGRHLHPRKTPNEFGSAPTARHHFTPLMYHRNNSRAPPAEEPNQKEHLPFLQEGSAMYRTPQKTTASSTAERVDGLLQGGARHPTLANSLWRASAGERSLTEYLAHPRDFSPRDTEGYCRGRPLDEGGLHVPTRRAGILNQETGTMNLTGREENLPAYHSSPPLPSFAVNKSDWRTESTHGREEGTSSPIHRTAPPSPGNPALTGHTTTPLPPDFWRRSPLTSGKPARSTMLVPHAAGPLTCTGTFPSSATRQAARQSLSFSRRQFLLDRGRRKFQPGCLSGVVEEEGQGKVEDLPPRFICTRHRPGLGRKTHVSLRRSSSHRGSRRPGAASSKYPEGMSESRAVATKEESAPMSRFPQLPALTAWQFFRELHEVVGEAADLRERLLRVYSLNPPGQATQVRAYPRPKNMADA